MNIAEAKAAVVKAGRELVKEGLIQRTWGNVSCRISDEIYDALEQSMQQEGDADA